MFKTKFKTDNAAFDGDPLPEIGQILRDLATKIERGYKDGIVVDSNGNKIGKYSLTKGD